MAVLCAIVLLAYSNSFTAAFTLDSVGLVLQDPRVHEVSSQNLADVVERTYWWPYSESGLYRPFTTLSFLFNYAVLGHGERPAGYHAINFLLHAANVLLLYALALRLVRASWPSFFLAAIWAVHPVLTESVTNIAGRADLLAGLTVLGGLLLYLKSREAKRWLIPLGVLGAAGFLAKENAVALLGIIVLYELVCGKRFRALLWGLLALLPGLQLMLYLRAGALLRVPPTEFPFWDNPLAGAGFWTAKLTALQVMGRYLGLLIWPAGLSCDYSYNQIPYATGSPADWFAWLAVALAGGVAVWMYWRNRVAFFFLVTAAIAFLPTANLLFPIGTIMAERFLYLPAIALAACAALGAYAASPRFAPAALCLLVAAFAVRTWARNADWRDPMTLAAATVRVSPNSYKSHRLLANAHTDIDAVIAEAEKSVAILDPVADWRNNPEPFRLAAGSHLEKGSNRRALELLLRARRIVEASILNRPAEQPKDGRPVRQPDYAKIADMDRALSLAYLRLGNAREAVAVAARARGTEPANAANYRQLAAALLAAGRKDDAAAALIVGTFFTHDMDLRRQWIDLYQEGLDTEGCATRPGPYGPAVNPACGVVRRHVCAAAAELVPLFHRQGRDDLGEQFLAGARRDFGCQP